jgi:phage terminase small subunit
MRSKSGSKTKREHVKKRIPKESGLTMKQRIFCQEYIFDWNATRAYRTAYVSATNDNSAAASASALLRNPKIQKYVSDIQDDLEKTCGLSKAKILFEHKKLAFSSIASLHNTWISRKEFETLTDDQKACISEIDTKIKTEFEYDPDNPKEKKPVEVEYVKIKLYDKQKALDSITKMLGYEAPSKTELTGKGGKPLIPTIQIEVIDRAEQVKNPEDDSGS